MKITEKEYSELNLKQIVFNEISFIRKKEHTISNTLNIDFNKNVEVREEEEECDVALYANISDKDDSFNLKIILTGYFSYVGLDPKIQQNVIQGSTVAILFPFLRSQISLITTQPNFPPIVLPPININSLLEEKNNNEK